MPMKASALVACFVAALLAAAPASAQTDFPLALQIGTGLQLPVGEFADVVGTGYGGSLGAGFGIASNVGIYAGYSWTRFTSDLPTGDVVDTGLSAGVSFVLTELRPDLHPWVGGGLVLHRLRLDDAAEQPDRGRPGLGIGGGFVLPLGTTVRLAPSIGYLRYTSAFPGRDDLPVSFLSLGLALNLAP